MYISPQQQFSKGRKNRRLEKVAQFPIVRIILALISLIPAILCFNLLFKNLEPRWTTYIGDVGAVIIFAFYYLGYSFYTKYVEKRACLELSREKSAQETGAGLLIGAILVFITTILIFYKGTFHVISKNPNNILIHAFFIFGLLAFVEELIFRGIVFRLLEEILGSWLSIFIIALIFSIVHLVHEKATVVSILAIALQDVILTGAFILTRRVWLCWGIHWGWNLAQDGILGMPNSGVELLPSWLNAEVSGPTWLTGGGIGIELSVLGILSNIVVGIIFIKIAKGRGQILRPIWKRRNRESARA